MLFLRFPNLVEAFLNDPPKIYFIACCFPPFGRGNSITNFCVANGLSKHFNVDVVSMEREEGGIIAYHEDAGLEEAVSQKIKVHRIRAARWWEINVLLYVTGILPCYFINWAWSVWRRRDDIFGQKGVIFTVYPVFSDLLVGYLISRRYKMPLLVDFRDDFSGVMASGWRRRLGWYYRFFEKNIVRRADKITVTTEELRKDLIERYGVANEKVKVVYNIVPTASRGRQNGSDVLNKPLRVIYAGAMSSIQKPEILLSAYANLQTDIPDLKERLIVEFYGPNSPYFRLRIRKNFIDGCQYGGFLPQAQIAEKVFAADIGFFSLSGATYSYATPTKLFDYIEAGVPILASLPKGAARHIIESFGIGLVADVGDVAGLSEKLSILAENEDLRNQFKKNMKDARREFNAQKQIEKFQEVLNVMNTDYKSD